MKLSSVVGLMMLSIIYVVPAMAQQTLSLEECVAIALENNKLIQMANQDLAKSHGQIVEAKAGVFPTLTGSANFSYQFEEPTMAVPAAFFGDDDSTEAEGKAPTYQPMASEQIEIPIGKKDNYQVTATLQQTLFNATAFIAPQAAKIYAKYAEWMVESSKQDVILSAKQAYYNVLLAQAYADVQQQALEQAEATLERIENYRDTGRAADFDVLRAEVEVANLRSDLIQAQNGVELTMVNLKNTLSIDINTNLTLTDSLTYQPASVQFDDALNEAKETRPDLQALQYQIAALDKYLTVQRSTRLPILTGMIQYDGQYDHYKIDGNYWESNFTGIVALNINYIPFLDGGRTTGLIQQAKADHRKSQIGYDQAVDYVILELKQALLNMEEASNRIESNRLNVSTAEEALKISELRYESGLNTQLEVRDARLALTLAQTNYIQALHDYNVARASLDKAMGVIQ